MKQKMSKMNTPAFLMFLGLLFTIIQQPRTNTLFVSPLPDVVTQYARVNTDCWNGYNKNIGLLAEEGQTGQYVKNLKVGDIIFIAYKDGQKETFRISKVRQYRAMSSSVLSKFVDEETGEVYSSIKLGNLIYCQHPRHLILQTCVDDGNGRLFIEATPMPAEYYRSRPQMR